MLATGLAGGGLTELVGAVFFVVEVDAGGFLAGMFGILPKIELQNYFGKIAAILLRTKNSFEVGRQLSWRCSFTSIWNMASPLITASRLPAKGDNGTKPYRPSSSRGIYLPPISSQNSSSEPAPHSEPAEERLRQQLPPVQDRLHSVMGQLNNEVHCRRILTSHTV